MLFFVGFILFRMYWCGWVGWIGRKDGVIDICIFVGVWNLDFGYYCFFLMFLSWKWILLYEKDYDLVIVI